MEENILNKITKLMISIFLVFGILFSVPAIVFADENSLENDDNDNENYYPLLESVEKGNNDKVFRPISNIGNEKNKDLFYITENDDNDNDRNDFNDDFNNNRNQYDFDLNDKGNNDDNRYNDDYDYNNDYDYNVDYGNNDDNRYNDDYDYNVDYGNNDDNRYNDDSRYNNDYGNNDDYNFEDFFDFEENYGFEKYNFGNFFDNFFDFEENYGYDDEFPINNGDNDLNLDIYNPIVNNRPEDDVIIIPEPEVVPVPDNNLIEPPVVEPIIIVEPPVTDTKPS